MVLRTGGREERRQDAIGVEEDGGMEERQVKIKTVRNCRRDEGAEEEANILILIFILTVMTEVDRTRSREAAGVAAKGDTSWLPGNTDTTHLFSHGSPVFIYMLSHFSSQMVPASWNITVTERREVQD